MTWSKYSHDELEKSGFCVWAKEGALGPVYCVTEMGKEPSEDTGGFYRLDLAISTASLIRNMK